MHANWPMYLRILLGLHIACGFTAFVCAPVALATAKGGKTHRRWGKIYFWAMAGVAVTALILSFALPIFFLAMVAVFSFYACFAAYRILYLKDLYKGGKPLALDWLAALVTVASSSLLFLMGFLKPALMGVGVVQIAGHSVSIVSIVFGLIGVRLGLGSIFDFLKPPTEKMFWWYSHHARHDCQLHRGHDRVLRREPRPSFRQRVVGMAVANDSRRAGNLNLDCLL